MARLRASGAKRVFARGFTARFHQVTYGMVLVAALPLFTTGMIGWPALPFMLGVLGLAYAHDVERLPRRLERRGWNTIVAFVMAWTVLRSLNPDTRFIAFLHSLLFLLAYRLLTPKRNREYLQVYVLAFFQLLVTTAYTPNFSLAPLLLIFMIVSTWALTSFQVKRGLDEEQRFLTGAKCADERSVHAPTEADALVGARPMIATAIVALGTFAATFPIFYSIPRLGTGFFLSPLVTSGNSTGFSEKVELGVEGRINRNRALAMRIEFAHPEDVLRIGARHLRGVALNHYDGQGWSKRGLDEHPVDAEGDRSLPPKRFMVGRGPGGRETIEYTVYQEPLNTGVLFGFYHPFQMIVGVDQLRKDDGDTVSLPRIYPSAIKYIVQSYLDEPDPQELRNTGDRYGAELRANYLGLPDELDPRVGELAERLTVGLGNAYDRAMAIQRYLEEEYTYTLDLARNDNLLPLEDFLFEQRKGHCEYFATALAVMLRELSIPTRIVNGFVRGEWNDIGDYLAIRQSDAHSWVEVFFSESGWVAFDPSPRSIEPITGVEHGRYERARQALDAAQMAWNRYVLDFSVNDQKRAVLKMARFYSVNRPRGPNPMRWFSRQGNAQSGGARKAFGAVIVAALVGFALFNLVRNPKGRHRLGKAASKDAVLMHGFYADMLKRLDRRGLKKDPAVTPREFQRSVRKLDREAAPAVGALTELFEQARFGGRTLSAEEKASAEQALRQLSRRTRGKTGEAGKRPPPAREALGPSWRPSPKDE